MVADDDMDALVKPSRFKLVASTAIGIPLWLGVSMAAGMAADESMKYGENTMPVVGAAVAILLGAIGLLAAALACGARVAWAYVHAILATLFSVMGGALVFFSRGEMKPAGVVLLAVWVIENLLALTAVGEAREWKTYREYLLLR